MSVYATYSRNPGRPGACSAGEDVIAPFLADRKAHVKELVRPLQEKEETVGKCFPE
jgi:hypothetical protein